jgi:integrase
MTGVRSHHEGSIYRHKARGVWVAAISLPDGRRRRRQAKTRPEALAELRAMQRALSAEAIDASRIRLGDYLARWVSDDHDWAPATRRKHESAVRVHLAPSLGAHRLSELSVRDVGGYLASLRLDARSVGHLRATLRRALEDARRDSLVTVNVAALAQPPKQQPRERPILDAAQARILLDSTRGTRYGPLWTILVTTGLRISEALGLAWGDVERDSITVRHALQRVDGEWQLRPPKTAKGRRTIPLTQLGVDALRTQREQQASDRGATGLEGLVFTTERGMPHHATNLLPRLRADLEAAGLPRVGLHDLRHSCATVLFGVGVPLPVIADMLGHSTIRVTADLYRHRVPELARDAAERMQEALGA